MTKVPYQSRLHKGSVLLGRTLVCDLISYHLMPWTRALYNLKPYLTLYFDSHLSFVHICICKWYYDTVSIYAGSQLGEGLLRGLEESHGDEFCDSTRCSDGFNMYTEYSRELVKIDSIAFDVLKLTMLRSPSNIATALKKMRDPQLTLRTVRQDREQSIGSKMLCIYCIMNVVRPKHPICTHADMVLRASMI